MKPWDNLIPADVFFGRAKEVITKRKKLKEQTLALRRQHYLQAVRFIIHQTGMSPLYSVPEPLKTYKLGYCQFNLHNGIHHSIHLTFSWGRIHLV